MTVVCVDDINVTFKDVSENARCFYDVKERISNGRA